MTQKLSFEEVFAYFKEQGCELLSKEYHRSNDKLDYRCSCGNISSIAYGSFRQGHRCRECGKKKSEDTIVRRYGPERTVIIEKRRKTCKQRYGVSNPTQRPETIEKMKYTYDEVRSYFEEQGCELLSEQYINSRTKLKYRCSCGRLAEIEYRSFRSGKRCRTCGRERALETNRKNHGGVLAQETEEYNARRRQKFIETLGVDSPMKSEKIKHKREQTNKKRYGVPHVSQDPIIRKNQMRGLRDKHGYEYTMQVPWIKEKFMRTLKDRYGVTSLAHLSRCASKESQKLFWELHSHLPEEIKIKNHFAEFNAEFVVTFEKQCYKYDFVNSVLKKCIEYNGYNFHPKAHQPDDEIGWCAFHPERTVREAREYEFHKFQALQNRNYEILVVWDFELHENFDSLVKKCIEFLMPNNP